MYATCNAGSDTWAGQTGVYTNNIVYGVVYIMQTGSSSSSSYYTYNNMQIERISFNVERVVVVVECYTGRPIHYNIISDGLHTRRLPVLSRTNLKHYNIYRVV